MRHCLTFTTYIQRVLGFEIPMMLFYFAGLASLDLSVINWLFGPWWIPTFSRKVSCSCWQDKLQLIMLPFIWIKMHNDSEIKLCKGFQQIIMFSIFNSCHAGPIFIQEIQNTIMTTDASVPGRRWAISGHNGASCPVPHISLKICYSSSKFYRDIIKCRRHPKNFVCFSAKINIMLRVNGSGVH